MSKLTREQVEEIIQRENGRVGLRLEDKHGQSFWITDISADERVRVVSELGEPCWWNEAGQMAVPIRKKVFAATARVVSR